MRRAWIEKHGRGLRIRYYNEAGRIKSISVGRDRKYAEKERKRIQNLINEENMTIPLATTFKTLHNLIEENLRPVISGNYHTLLTRALHELRKYTPENLNSVSMMHVDVLISKLLKAGLSPSTVNTYLRHCKAAFQKALEWGLITVNVFDRVRSLKVPERDIRIINEQEELDLIKAARRNLMHRCIIYLALDGGLRAAEIARLNIKEDFDPVMGEVRIRNREQTTKNKRQRKVFINIEERRDDLSKLQKRGMCYPFFNGNSRSVSQCFRRIRDRAKAYCSLHDLRRTCASRMMKADVPLAVICDYMGHASMSVTEEFYKKIMTESLFEARRVTDENRLSTSRKLPPPKRHVNAETGGIA